MGSPALALRGGQFHIRRDATPKTLAAKALLPGEAVPAVIALANAQLDEGSTRKFTAHDVPTLRGIAVLGEPAEEGRHALVDRPGVTDEDVGYSADRIVSILLPGAPNR